MGRYIRAVAKQRKEAHQRADAAAMPYDLFGVIPVTLNDIELWMASLGHTMYTARDDYYIKAWNVVEKIRRAKLRGDWPPKDEYDHRTPRRAPGER